MTTTGRIRLAGIVAGAVLIGSCGADRIAPRIFPDLAVMTDSLPTAMLGEPYAEAIQAEGGDGDYAWEVTDGELPPGLAIVVDDLGEDDAILTGVPDAEGTFTFTLTVFSGDGQSASQALSLEVLPHEALSIRTPAVPPALAGASYNVGLSAQGGVPGSREWALVQGTLPAGLEFTDAGRIVGTPAAVDTTVFTAEVRSGQDTDTRTFRLAVVPNRTGEFNITSFPVVEVPVGVQPHLDAAIAQWERAITDNFQALTIPTAFMGPDDCAGFGSLTNGTSLDDIIIIFNITPIESTEPGRVILGRAGPCLVRDTVNFIPLLGVVTLNSDYLEPLIGTETLTHIISHEIAHVLGFGTVWTNRGLLQGAGTADPRFTGQAAVAEYQALGGTGTVPVENEGGEGTRDSHWRLTVFQHELMVGQVASETFMPLSRVSIASFADIGFAVDLDAADDYSLAAALAVGAAGDHHHWEELGYDEVIREPLRVLDPDAGAGQPEP